MKLHYEKMWARKFGVFLASAFMSVLQSKKQLDACTHKLFLPEGNLHGIYFEKNELAKVIASYGNMLLKKDIKRYSKYYEARLANFLKWTIRKTRGRNFSISADGQLASLLTHLHKKAIDFSEFQFYAFLVLEGLGREIEKEFRERPDILESIATPYRLTRLMRARVELLEMAQQRWPGDDALQKYVNTYAWIPVYDFIDPPLQILDVRAQLKDIRHPQIELAEMKAYMRQGTRKYKSFLPTVHSKVLRKKIEIVHAFAYLKEVRDDYRRHAYYLWQPFWREVARRINVSFAETKYLTQEELAEALLYKKDFSRLVKERTRRYALQYDNGKLRVLTGPDINRALKLVKRNATKEVREQSAFSGKSSGKVNVLYHQNDFPKFRKGDVLVTPMTHVEFLPLMKIASAIITDEGGITCHAAIVSRELKIPCIIGTKIATEVLKDGDRVEVDATKGIVRKL
ncbi:MAG: PEP-utilizing enzyme [bacterium]|nr:PEP-utilizing enzyme [bacterium]